jgi:hypothetical protein
LKPPPGDPKRWAAWPQNNPERHGFNPDIRMVRTQTIMQGAAFCDFRFDLAL